MHILKKAGFKLLVGIVALTSVAVLPNTIAEAHSPTMGGRTAYDVDNGSGTIYDSDTGYLQNTPNHATII